MPNSGTPAEAVRYDASALAARIADYMTQRRTPWADEAVMREAVDETVRLLAYDAAFDMVRCIAISNPDALKAVG